MPYFMGIDSGTSGVKAVIMDEAGNVVSSGYSECDLIVSHPGWAEQAPDDWWRACREAVREAAAKSGLGKEVRGIGFSGQMQGSTLLDREMNPVGNCLLWLDQRSTAETDEINRSADRAYLLGITANMCLNSFWAPKLLWVKKHRPEDYGRIHKVLFTKDYLCYKLTGEITADVSDSSLSFLMDVYKRKWSGEMFEKLGIPREFAPDRLIESCEVAGYLKPDVAEDLGLAVGIPVAAGGGDQPVNGVGTGIVRTGVVGVSIGTSGVVSGCADKPFVDDGDRAMYSMAHSVPEKWYFLGLALSSGGSYKWLRDTVFADKKAEMAEKGLDVYDYMSGLAEAVSPGSEGLAFLPYLNGEKTPHCDDAARGVFFGLSFRHGLGAISRSVMEGVTFSLRDTVEIFRDFGLDVTEIRASGGGAKSALWRQMQADIFNANVVTMNMEEGPAAGAAILGAVAAGHFKSVEEGCDALLKIKSVTEPNSKNAAIYDDYYRVFRELYPALKVPFRRQAANVEKYL